MEDKTKQLYDALESSADFKGVFASPEEMSDALSKDPKAFYDAINLSPDFNGVFTNADEFISSVSVKKKGFSLEDYSVTPKNVGEVQQKTEVENQRAAELKNISEGQSLFASENEPIAPKEFKTPETNLPTPDVTNIDVTKQNESLLNQKVGSPEQAETAKEKIGGFLKEVNKGFASIFDAADYVQGTVGDALNEIMVGKETAGQIKELRKEGITPQLNPLIPDRPFKVIADAINWTASGNKNLPDNVGGDIARGVAGVVPLVVTSILVPEIKTAQVLENAGIATMSKFGLVMGAQQGIEASRTSQEGTPIQQWTAPAIGALEGYLTGWTFDNIGAISSKIGSRIAEKIIPKVTTTGQAINKALTQNVGSNLTNAVFFGGYGNLEEYLQTGAISPETFATNAGMGLVMGARETGKLLWAKGINSLVSVPADVLNRTANSPLSSEELASQAMDKIRLVESGETKDRESDVAAAMMSGKLSELKAVTEEIKSNPDEVINSIKESTLNDNVKEVAIDKVNDVIANMDERVVAAKPLSEEINKIDDKIENIKNNKSLSSVDKEIQTEQLKQQREELKVQIEDIYNKPKEAETQDEALKPEEEIKGETLKPEVEQIIGGKENAEGNGTEVEERGQQPQGVEQGEKGGLRVRDVTQNRVETPKGEEVSYANDMDMDRGVSDRLATAVSRELKLPEPEYLAEGGKGHAYKSGEDKVIKITTDLSESANAKIIAKEKPEGVVGIERVRRVEDKETGKVYHAIEQEFIPDRPVEKLARMRDVVDETTGNDIVYWVKKGMKLTPEEAAVEADRILTENPESNISEVERKDAREFIMRVYEIGQNLRKIGITNLTDMTNVNNFGYKDGKLVFFDVGFGKQIAPEMLPEETIRVKKAQVETTKVEKPIKPKTWRDFMSYNRTKDYSVKMKMMTVPELLKVRKSFEKYLAPFAPYSQSQIKEGRSKIRDMDELIEAHKKADEFNLTIRQEKVESIKEQQKAVAAEIQKPEDIAKNIEGIFEGTSEGINTYSVDVNGQPYTFTAKVDATEAEVKAARDKTIKEAEAKPSDIESTIREAYAKGQITKEDAEAAGVKIEKSIEPKLSKVEQAKQNLKAAWDDLNTQGIIFDPRSNAEKQVKLTKAALEYIKEVAADTVDKVKTAIKDVLGIELSEENAKYLLEQSEAKIEEKPIKTEEKQAKSTEPKGEETFERETLRKMRDESVLSAKFKEWLSAHDITTTRLPNDVTDKEVDFIIASNGLEKAKSMLTDMNNNLSDAVRSMMAVRLVKTFDDLATEADKVGDTVGADAYRDKAFAITDWLGDRNTNLARGLQALGSAQALEVLSPKTAVRMARKDARSQRDNQIKKSEVDIKKKAKTIKKAQSESVEEALISDKYTNVKNKVTGKEAEPQTYTPKEKIKKEKEFRVSKWAELRRAREIAKAKGGVVGFAATPVHAEEARIAGEIVRSYVRSGVYKMQDIINRLQRDWKKYIGEDLSYEDAVKLVPEKIDEKNIEEALDENANAVAAKRLSDRIMRMLQDPKLPKNDPIKQLINTLFDKIAEKNKTPKVQTTKPNLEKIKEAIEDKKTYADAWEAAKKEVQDRIETNADFSEDQIAEYNDILDSFYNEVIGKPYAEKQVSAAVRDKIKDMGTSIDEIVRQHYNVYDATRRTLQEKLVDELDLSGEDAAMLADAVGKEFDKIATKRKMAILTKGITPREVVHPKQTKDVWQKLVELSNLGAWSDTAFAEAYAEKMGFPELTEANRKEIERLSTRIQDANPGFQKYEAIQDLLAYQAKLPGMDLGDMAMSFWYSSILSGGRTQFKNVFANAMNTLAEFAISARKPQNIPSLLSSLILGHVQGARMAGHIMKTGYVPIRGGKVEGVGSLELWKFKGGAINPANWFKYVPRIMMAADAISYHGLKEMRSWELAMSLARQADAKAQYPNLPTMARAMEILYNTEARVQEANVKAEAEGLSGNAKRRRVWEIMEQSRPVELVAESHEFAARGTFNHAPEGTMGALTELIGTATQNVAMKVNVPFTNKTATIRPLKFFVPFTRIISNVTNVALEYTPYGFVRAAKKGIGFEYYDNPEAKVKWGKGKYRKYSKDEQQRAFTKALVGTSAMALLYILSGEDDDGESPITITANGTGDYAKNVELSNANGWQQYSIKIGDKWYSYQYTPLFLALAPVGYLRDAEKYKKEDWAGTTWEQKIEMMMMQTSTAMMDMSWMSSLSGLFEALSATNKGTFESFWNKMGVSMGKSIIYPKLIEQSVQVFDKINKTPRKDSGKFMGKILKDVPVVRNAYHVMLNAAGEPVLYDPVLMMSDETQDPFWEFIVENNAFIGKQSQKSLKVWDDINKAERLLDDDEYYDYIRLSGSAIKERIQNEVIDKNMSRETVKEEVDKIKAEERKRVKVEMFGWGDFRNSNPDNWLILRDGMALQNPKTYKEVMVNGKKHPLTQEELKEFNNIAIKEYSDNVIFGVKNATKEDRTPIEGDPSGLSYFDRFIDNMWIGACQFAESEMINKLETESIEPNP